MAVALSASLPSAAQHTEQQMRNCVFLFHKQEQARKFLDDNFDHLHFAPGEHIADIGAKGANMAGILSLFYSNIELTLEDIDTACLSPEQVAFVLHQYELLDGHAPSDIHYDVVIGNDTSTTLPANYFTKVFLINTFHEITKKDAMLRDLYRITAPGGMLYVQEKVSLKKPVMRKDCHHLMPIQSALVAAFEAAGFKLVKINVTRKARQLGNRIIVGTYHFSKS